MPPDVHAAKGMYGDWQKRYSDFTSNLLRDGIAGPLGDVHETTVCSHDGNSCTFGGVCTSLCCTERSGSLGPSRRFRIWWLGWLWFGIRWLWLGRLRITGFGWLRFSRLGIAAFRWFGIRWLRIGRLWITGFGWLRFSRLRIAGFRWFGITWLRIGRLWITGFGWLQIAGFWSTGAA
jgi:hypothetical protein